ncbi:hypothetical protein [Actinocrispum sp. NPDC049592]|uniref:hypothetical protein n=1 Tax=Actinocrispum sp. NPDC049592 TaxID=3154835 RepID=UPI0034220508
MTVPVESLVAELKILRRGRGVQAPGVDRQVGPNLRRLCDIGDVDGAGLVREKIRAWVTDLIRPFPDDLRLAVTTTFALNPVAQHKFHADRVAWLAQRADRDARTIRRRIDDALTRLAEAAVMPAHHAEPGGEEWHLKRFSALLRLDGISPVCHEVREIVAQTDGVDEIPWSFSLPGSLGELDVEIVQGAVFSRIQRPSARRLLLRLQLPETLRAGQAHQFAMEVRVAPGQPMRPSFVFWPDRRCEQFDLVVRFAADQLPRAVWRVRDALQESQEIGQDRLVPNSIGEVRARFTEPRPGRGHGIQWQP